MSGNQPDLILKALNKETNATNKVGAAWYNLNEKGDVSSISLRIDLCVHLNDNPNIVLTLFPASSQPEKKRKQQAGEEGKEPF